MAQASFDMTFSCDPNKAVPSMIAGAVNAACAAAKEASVKRFAYTSSSVAITIPKPHVESTISVDQWNDEDIAKAQAPPPYVQDWVWSVYAASET